MFIPAVLDIEASGFGRGSYPIEVGYVNSDQVSGCSLIKPLESWTSWCQDAYKIHGIERDILFKAGKPVKEVALWLNEMLGGMTVYSDAWMNDMCWLGRLFDEAEVCQRFKLESILDLLTEDERDRWAAVYQFILEQTKLTRHRASNDARLIQQTFLAIKTCL